MNNNQPLSTILSCKKRKKTQKNALFIHVKNVINHIKIRADYGVIKKNVRSQINNNQK